ncbi:MAG: MltA domain-containing protein [Planctomycetota bacterium]|jgi:membrane-bound lytic murein transglycosylase A
MRPNSRILPISVFLVSAGAVLAVGSLLPGCAEPTEEAAPLIVEKNYSAPLPAGAFGLRKISDPARIPDFSAAFHLQIGLDQAAERSLHYLSKPSSQRYFPYGPQGEITHHRVVRSLQRFRQTLAQAASPAELDDLIRRRFEVWESVGCDGQGTVLFTGYYRPIFDARLRPDAEFKYPLYRLPGDLVKDEEGNCLGRRLPGGGVGPTYYDRRQIVSSDALAGQELCYLRDPFEAYIVTVQGSAKLRMEDGRYLEIGYVANNGHEYVPIGKLMVADGKIPADELSLGRMIRFFREFPNEIRYYTNQNPRYVFFEPRPGGPFGSLNEQVTPYRTIATDKEIYPRACPTFVQTRLPGYDDGRIVERAYHGFALDQDTGGAIRAPGRCDVFMGTGDAVAELAGRTLAEGKLYYLFARQ